MGLAATMRDPDVCHRFLSDIGATFDIVTDAPIVHPPRISDRCGPPLNREVN
jgi:hypothetical protein